MLPRGQGGRSNCDDAPDRQNANVLVDGGNTGDRRHNFMVEGFLGEGFIVEGVLMEGFVVEGFLVEGFLVEDFLVGFTSVCWVGWWPASRQCHMRLCGANGGDDGPEVNEF